MAKEINIEELTPIVKELRQTVELMKKGEPEGISTDEGNERALALLNRMRRLLGEAELEWEKDENGKWFLAEV